MFIHTLIDVHKHRSRMCINAEKMSMHSNKQKHDTILLADNFITLNIVLCLNNVLRYKWVLLIYFNVLIYKFAMFVIVDGHTSICTLLISLYIRRKMVQ